MAVRWQGKELSQYHGGLESSAVKSVLRRRGFEYEDTRGDKEHWVHIRHNDLFVNISDPRVNHITLVEITKACEEVEKRGDKGILYIHRVLRKRESLADLKKSVLGLKDEMRAYFEYGEDGKPLTLTNLAHWAHIPEKELSQILGKGDMLPTRMSEKRLCEHGKILAKLAGDGDGNEPPFNDFFEPFVSKVLEIKRREHGRT